MSPVFRVSICDPTSLGVSEAVLKLYDYRCMANIRKRCGSNLPWSEAKELAYRQYLKGSPLPVEILDDPEYLDEELGDGEFEAYLECRCQVYYENESQTYGRLKEGQGAWLPKLYFSVSISREDRTTVKGLLLEYIPSISLRDFVSAWKTHVPPLPITNLLKQIGDAAVAVVERVSDFDVLNGDLRLDNILVRASALADGEGTKLVEPSEVVLIDLASCRFRLPDETDEQWRKSKRHEDESGAVGIMLLSTAEEHVGKGVWAYHRCTKNWRLYLDGEES